MGHMVAKADNVKAKARELIEQLPDNATWDDVAYESPPFVDPSSGDWLIWMPAAPIRAKPCWESSWSE